MVGKTIMGKFHINRGLVLLCIVMLVQGGILYGQDVQFMASAPSVVSVGEQFRLDYTLNGAPSSFQGPQINDFYVLSGPNKSSSTSIQIINGRRSQSVTITYTYYLQATREGKYTIGPASCVLDKKQYNSNEVSIEVVKEAGAANQPRTSPGPASTQKAAGATDQLYVRILTDRNSVYLGQHIVATLKLYTRLDVTGLGKADIPDFNGFWSQEIPQPSQISLQRENVNGVIYNTGIIKKVLLFPQRSGEISIEPFELEVIVRQKVGGETGGIWDDFFSTYTNVSKPLVSKPVTISVMSLPGNEPASFNGAVGQMKMSTTLDRMEAKTNDAITMKVSISGNGNIKLVEAPVINFPPDFETYDPKVTTNIQNTENGQTGSKTFEYLLIPRHAGKYRLPPVHFSYFDLSEKKYKSVSGQEYNITVSKGDEEEVVNITPGLSREEYQKLGTDILYIKSGPFSLYPLNRYLFGSLHFFMIYILALALFLFVVILGRAHIKRMQNVEMIRNRRANRLAGKKLKTAHDYLRTGQKEHFYEAVLNALMGYLSDKLNIPYSELTREKVVSVLGEYKVDPEITSRLMDLVHTCEQARYSPLEESAEMKTVYSDTVKFLSDLEKNLKR
jgi:hypothetical protein